MQLAVTHDRSVADDRLGLEFAQRPWYSYSSGLKRALDIFLALVGIAATLPLWIAIAIAIKIESRGPIFFVQKRVGRNMSPFPFIKFRSMHTDAEERRQQLLHLNQVSGPVFKIRRDPRVTRVGRILRRSSLDELPQLINVLRGEMSVVGPRPPTPNEVAKYRPVDMIRLSIRPGLTCWWQIRGRSDVDFDTWMEYDREYVSGISLVTDLRIILGTFTAVLSGRGAY
ncbi:MAG: sugar transferase [Candidatus Dormibacteraeota bacterium]|nr:sugar transferase [Candidatus Dormibacteraeota bacterium]